MTREKDILTSFAENNPSISIPFIKYYKVLGLGLMIVSGILARSNFLLVSVIPLLSGFVVFILGAFLTQRLVLKDHVKSKLIIPEPMIDLNKNIERDGTE